MIIEFDNSRRTNISLLKQELGLDLIILQRAYTETIIDPDTLVETVSLYGLKIELDDVLLIPETNYQAIADAHSPEYTDDEELQRKFGGLA